MPGDDANQPYPLAWQPGHFYSPIPDLNAIAHGRDRIFDAPVTSLAGIDLNTRRQLRFLKRLGRAHEPGFFHDQKRPDRRFFYDNDNYRHGEALVLMGFLRSLQARRIVEVGSGYSTCAVLDIRDAFLPDLKVTSIEPHPQLLDSLLRDGDRSTMELVAEPVQTVGLAPFMRLQRNDILLIDSTHVVKTDSDVTHHLFRILPALARGVYVHFHDIYFPFEYPENWVMEGRAWNEIYALRAFLQYNRAFEIVHFASYLSQMHRDRVEAHMPASLRSPCSSLWLRKR
jgi:hypothetical protein